jgi:predicted O-methyltransferase YrrM
LRDFDFDPLWKFLTDRSQRGVMTVQNREELKHIYDLIQGCKSYLEVGTAEGNSLYLLSHALINNSSRKVVYIDLCENHTRGAREEAMQRLYLECNGLIPTCISGNSHEPYCVNAAYKFGAFDVVMIDAGHTYEDVLADAVAYGGLAKKFLIFHDVMLPPVKAAMEWYAQQAKKKTEYFIRSTTFGYGVITL